MTTNSILSQPAVADAIASLYEAIKAAGDSQWQMEDRGIFSVLTGWSPTEETLSSAAVAMSVLSAAYRDAADNSDAADLAAWRSADSDEWTGRIANVLNHALRERAENDRLYLPTGDHTWHVFRSVMHDA